MTWELVFQILVLVLAVGGVVGAVIMTIGYVKKDAYGSIANQLGNWFTQDYMPSVREFTIETAEDFMGMLKKEIPEVMGSIKEIEDKWDEQKKKEIDEYLKDV